MSSAEGDAAANPDTVNATARSPGGLSRGRHSLAVCTALSLEKMMIDTLGQSLEAETHKVLMVTDSEAPNFDTHDFRADITAEVTGTGYTPVGWR